MSHLKQCWVRGLINFTALNSCIHVIYYSVRVKHFGYPQFVLIFRKLNKLLI